MSCENCEESAYVIDKLAKLLAEIAIIVNGTEPHDTLWSYHDLPEKVSALKQAQQPAAAVPDCGCCKGDGSMCPTVCRHAEENPPIFDRLPENEAEAEAMGLSNKENPRA